MTQVSAPTAAAPLSSWQGAIPWPQEVGTSGFVLIPVLTDIGGMSAMPFKPEGAVYYAQMVGAAGAGCVDGFGGMQGSDSSKSADQDPYSNAKIMGIVNDRQVYKDSR